jgi:hypothetical protein
MGNQKLRSEDQTNRLDHSRTNEQLTTREALELIKQAKTIAEAAGSELRM